MIKKKKTKEKGGAFSKDLWTSLTKVQEENFEVVGWKRTIEMVKVNIRNVLLMLRSAKF